MKGFSAAIDAPTKRPLPLVPRCGECGLFRHCKSPKMGVAGQGRKKILVVGEAPGAQEDDQGEPFVGASGELVSEVMAKVGIDFRTDCWIMNAAACFVGDVCVQSPSKIFKLYRRKYTGLLVSVYTFSGRVLTGTPNHPILTPKGWVPLGLLDEGDDLVNCSFTEGASFSGPNVYNPPTSFDELFESFVKFGDVQRMVGGGMDFHGDGEHGDVDVVTSSGFLRTGKETTGNQHVNQLRLKSPGLGKGEFSASGVCSLEALGSIDGPFSSSGCGVGGFGNGLAALNPQTLHADLHGVASVAKFNAAPQESQFKFAVGDTERVCKRLQSLAGFVTLDRVVKVERKTGDQSVNRDDASYRSCHVYNLETDDGYYIANGIVVSNCRPENNKLPPKAVEHCRPLVVKAIEELRPRVILLLGGSAIKSVLGWLWREDVGAAGRWEGWAIPSQKLNAWVCPMGLPFDKVWFTGGDESMVRMFFERHVAAAVALHGSRPWKERPQWERQVKVLLDPDEAAREFVHFRRWTETAAFDLETTSLKPYSNNAEIYCCSLSNGDYSFAFPWHGAAIDAMRDFLVSDVSKIGFNCKFESVWLKVKLGVTVRNWIWDGMIATHVLDNRDSVCSLKFQAFARLGMGAYDDEVAPYLKAKGSHARNRICEAPLDNVLRYCAMDSLLEWKLCELQQKEFDR